MTPAHTDTSAYAIELDERQSSRLLEHATRAGAETSLLPHTRSDGLAIAGTFVGATEEGLLVQLVDEGSTDPMSLVSAYCEVTVSLDQARFLFSSTIIDARHEESGVRFEIARPTHLHVIQRRRYQRRDLRCDTPVRITPFGQENQPALEAALLNISTGGMACRISQAGADRCAFDDPVNLEFSVADCTDTFHMPAHLRSKTTGASAGQVILSFEFAAGPEFESQREGLADALYGNLVALTGG